MADDDIDTSALLDWVTSVDNILREIQSEELQPSRQELESIRRNTEQVANELQSVRSQIASQTDVLASIAAASGLDIEPRQSREYTIGFGTNVPANTSQIDPIVQEREIQFDGQISGLVVVFPNGTQQAAGVQIARGGGEKLFPRNDESAYLGLDDVTQEFSLSAPVSEGGTIDVKFANTDPNNAHYISGGIFVTEEANVA
jgi:hypothetical protein